MSELNERGKLRSSLGIPTLAKLVAWARMVHEVYPNADILVGGSARDSKTWRDIDVYITFPDMGAYKLATGGGPIHDDVLGAGWDVLAAAWSSLAREVTGAAVEARFMCRPSDWLNDTICILAAAGQKTDGEQR